MLGIGGGGNGGGGNGGGVGGGMIQSLSDKATVSVKLLLVEAEGCSLSMPEDELVVLSSFVLFDLFKI